MKPSIARYLQLVRLYVVMAKSRPVLTLLSISKRLPAWVLSPFESYQKRLKRLPLAHVALSPSRHSSAPSASRDETQRLLEKADSLGLSALWVWNPEGTQRTTEALSEHLFSTLENYPRLGLLLGGAYGLDRSLLKPSGSLKHIESLSLSSLTLPHELCHLVLIEQLYRLESVYLNHPYHHQEIIGEKRS